MQPLPVRAGVHEHVHHHLLPSRSRQVRLPPGLSLSDLQYAQLRGARTSSAARKPRHVWDLKRGVNDTNEMSVRGRTHGTVLG